MSSVVTLEATRGELAGQSFRFSETIPRLFIGRNPDCGIVLTDRTVSRYHCALEIRPPEVHLQDFGSLNGTRLDGKLIGRREKGQAAPKDPATAYEIYTLRDGMVLGIGKNADFTVRIETAERCADCGKEMLFRGGETSAYTNDAGEPLCASCHERLEERKKPCVSCGKRFLPTGEGNNQCPDCLAERAKIIADTLKGLKLPTAPRTEKKTAVPSILEGYDCVAGLGKGTRGEVMRVRRQSDGQEFALKTMQSRVLTEEKGTERFLREATISMYLHHPNVVETFDVGDRDGVIYILMEVCEGGNVLELMERYGGKLPVEPATYIILQTLAGLDYVHNAELPVHVRVGGEGYELDCRGVVHRDLKPANLFLTDRSEKPSIKVADFGFAKAVDAAGLSDISQTVTDRFGTKAYMCRQQCINYKYSKQDVDVWSAAASYFHMLTGDTAKNFDQDKNPLSVILHDEARPIRSLTPNIPGSMAEVIDRALRERPTIGFSTAAEFRTELVRALPDSVRDYCKEVL